jgi:glycosyltransferase involved in cell wall biosynthesis
VRVDERTGAADRITYLIANHNLASYIGDCLSSLRRQTNPNWLALVLDDASTDDSLQAIAPFMDERIRLLINERNLGYIAALKRLIAQAPTDIVAILDADDAISPDATERLLDAYGADPGTEFVYSRFATYDVALETREAADGTAVADGSTAIHGGAVGHILSFRRKAYARTGGLDDSILYAEDRDLVYKLEEVTRPIFIDAVLYYYRKVPTSQSRVPDKREIGAINTWRARRAALRRRRVRGTERMVYELFCWADYLAYSHRPPVVVRRLASWLATGTRHLCRRVDARRAEQREREGIAS